MKYFYEGKLIGVSVVDFVDDGLSAVYFFYDPHFKDFRLGVFSSLMEIEYIRWLKLSFPEFRYYYMGFYISNCEKMNYKGK
jgi:arginyl-tRNA---protein transferase